MDSSIITPVIILVVLAAALGFAAILFRLWRRRVPESLEGDRSEVRPQIGFSDLDGMVSIALLLSNQSNEFIWAEEILIFLTDLRADDQVRRPPSARRKRFVR